MEETKSSSEDEQNSNKASVKIETRMFDIRLPLIGQKKIMDLAETQNGGENHVIGIIRRPLTNLFDTEECIEFRLRNNDTVYYDLKK
jgi:hypothetical protein